MYILDLYDVTRLSLISVCKFNQLVLEVDIEKALSSLHLFFSQNSQNVGQK